MVKKISAKSFVWLILFLMYLPILVLVAYSFTNTKNIGIWDVFTFELYSELFQSPDIMNALYNTLLVAISSAIISTLLGTLGAIGIFYNKKRARNVLNAVSQIPVMNDEIVTALSLTLLFVFFSIQFNFITLLIGHVVLTVPFVVLSVTPKLKQMDPNIYEAALDLGATPKRALWGVVVPEILPGIIAGFVLSITLSLDDYIITVFTRNNSFETLSTFIYGVTAKKGSLPPALRALTTIIFVIVLVGLFLYNYQMDRAVKRRSRRR